MLWMATEAQFILGLNSRQRKYLRKASIRHSFTNQSHGRIMYVFLTDRRWSVIFLRALYSLCFAGSRDILEPIRGNKSKLINSQQVKWTVRAVRAV